VGGSIQRDPEVISFPYTPPPGGVTTREVVIDSVGPFRRWEREMAILTERADEPSLRRYGERLEAYERLGGYEIEAHVERELASLGVGPELLDRDFHTLSGGERTRALIVPLFLRTGTYPLLDEPTNHLDGEGRRLLGAYLARQPGFLLVSHDRALLDQAVDHIVAINRSDVRLHATNYSGWRRQLELTEIYERRRDQNLAREVKALEASARERRSWSGAKEAEKRGAHDKGYVGAMAARQMKRALQIERRTRAQLEEKRSLLANAEKTRRLRLHPDPGGPEELLRVQDVVVRLGGRTILDGISFTVRRGERVAIIGPNGSGKTTLLRVIAGDLCPEEGTVVLPSRVEVARAYQDPLWQDGLLVDHLHRAGLDEWTFRRSLGSFEIDRDVFDRPLETWSLGQRKKVDLCRSFVSPAHLYVWDEPLNEIDLESREAIERAVLEHAPTLVFVEHDQRFVEWVGTRAIRL
jgi:lincosamide and streptogramin A transport system ATP-binding/permease protein